MSKVRYFIIPHERRWTIRSSRRRVGAFADREQAVMIALELAVIERLHGRLAEVLNQDAEGRWRNLSLTDSTIIL